MCPAHMYVSDMSFLCQRAGFGAGTCTAQAQHRRELRLKDFSLRLRKKHLSEAVPAISKLSINPGLEALENSGI